MPIIHTPSYTCGLPKGHRFQMGKFNAVFASLLEDKEIELKKQVLEPAQIDRELVELVHCKDYVNKFYEGKTTRDEQRRTGFTWTHGLKHRVLYECGGTYLAALCALERGLCCSTAGGTHHAGPDYGSGYCLLNDLAVTAAGLTSRGLVKRVLVLDLDVHQGDGTALIFQHQDSVFTFSIHCQKNFPFRKQASDWDIGLERGVGDQDYLALLSDVLPELLDRSRPDMVLYDAGVDPHVDDELGHLSLTDRGLLARDRLVIEACLARGVPTATVIGGGYNKDVNKLGRRHSIVHRAATDVWRNRLS